MHAIEHHGPAERVWTGPHGRVVAGIFSLAFLVAFESLAVATVMPVVADDLDGLGLYALSFAAPIAIGVVSMTLAGPLMDRRGPGPGLRTGVAVFVVGLVVAGLARSMDVFLVGRAVQGLGMGLVGPFVAGTVTDLVGWRWVFLGVPVVAVASLALIWQALDAIDGTAPVGEEAGAARSDRRRVVWAVLVATGVLSVSVAGQRAVSWWPVLLVVAVTLTVVYAPRLVPPGTWRGRRGLPGVVATRSLLSAGFFGAETYVPLSLVEHRGTSVTHAGLLLTGAAVLWFGGSWIAAHVGALASKPLRVRLGSVCVLAGTGSGFLTLVDAVPVPVVAMAWAVGGLGMGMAASTLGVLLLDHSAPGEQGANSAGMQINDAVTQSLVLALGSVVFAVVLTVDELLAYVLVFALAACVGLAAVLMSSRVDPR